MNLKEMFLLTGAVITGTILLFFSPDPHRFTKGGGHPAVVEASQIQELSNVTKESLVDTEENVTITVTPPTFSEEVSEWKFSVGINTHSLELDQDLTKVAILVDDRGGEYKPIGWGGAGPGGHHREGVLTFKSIIPAPRSVELRIVNVGVPVRSFVWKITN